MKTYPESFEWRNSTGAVSRPKRDKNAHRLPAKKEPCTLPDMREAMDGAWEMLNARDGLRAMNAPVAAAPEAPTVIGPEAAVPACEGVYVPFTTLMESAPAPPSKYSTAQHSTAQHQYTPMKIRAMS